MNRAIVVKLTAAVVIAIFAVSSWVTSGELDLTWLRFFSAAVLIVTLLLTAYDLWLWRIPLVQKLPGVPRNVRGTWKGTIASMWGDPATGSQVSPIDAFLVVRQTSTTVSVRLFTQESSSSSTLARVAEPDGSPVLDYLYLNRPRTSVRDRSPMHHGSVALEVSGTPAHRLTGRYWTDRDSKGEMRFEDRRSKIVDDFDDAAALFRGGAA